MAVELAGRAEPSYFPACLSEIKNQLGSSHQLLVPRSITQRAVSLESRLGSALFRSANFAAFFASNRFLKSKIGQKKQKRTPFNLLS